MESSPSSWGRSVAFIGAPKIQPLCSNASPEGSGQSPGRTESWTGVASLYCTQRMCRRQLIGFGSQKFRVVSGRIREIPELPDPGDSQGPQRFRGSPGSCKNKDLKGVGELWVHLVCVRELIPTSFSKAYHLFIVQLSYRLKQIEKRQDSVFFLLLNLGSPTMLTLPLNVPMHFVNTQAHG